VVEKGVPLVPYEVSFVAAACFAISRIAGLFFSVGPVDFLSQVILFTEAAAPWSGG